jgi:succinate-acetate transporter protein
MNVQLEHTTRNSVATVEARGVASAIANPSALGLASFAGPALLLSFVNAGVLDASALVASIVPIGMFYGGLIQILAGILEFRRGNTFGTVAFGTYGAFWLSFAAYTRWFSTNASAAATAYFILMFVLITAFLAVAAVRVNVVVCLVFTFQTLSFAILTIASFRSSREIQHVGGWVELVAAFIALYAAGAILVNDTWKRTVLPLFPRTP